MSISEERSVTLNLHFLTQFKWAMSKFVLISGVFTPWGSLNPYQAIVQGLESTREVEMWLLPAWWATCLWQHWVPWTAALGGNNSGRPRRRSPRWPRLRAPPWNMWGDAGRCAAHRGCCTAPMHCFWSECSFLCDTWRRLMSTNDSRWSGVGLERQR